MSRVTRLASSVLLAGGVLLIFTGLSAALGFTAIGMLASAAVIGGLLYGGRAWSAEPPISRDSESVLVYDSRLTLASGAPLLARFPEQARGEVRARCEAALAGERSLLVVGARAFHVTPLLADDGRVLYGALVEQAGASGVAYAAPTLDRHQS